MSHNFLTGNFSCSAGRHAFLKSIYFSKIETTSWLAKVRLSLQNSGRHFKNQ